jgi:hypothetical protein
MKNFSHLIISKFKCVVFAMLCTTSFFLVSASYATPSTCTTSLCNCSWSDGSCGSNSQTTCYNKKSGIDQSCQSWCSYLPQDEC